MDTLVPSNLYLAVDVEYPGGVELYVHRAVPSNNASAVFGIYKREGRWISMGTSYRIMFGGSLTLRLVLRLARLTPVQLQSFMAEAKKQGDAVTADPDLFESGMGWTTAVLSHLDSPYLDLDALGKEVEGLVARRLSGDARFLTSAQFKA